MTQTTNKLSSNWQTKFRRLFLKQGEKLLRKLEQQIGKASLVSDRTFFEVESFDWVVEVESNWLKIRQELDLLLENVEQLPNFQDISEDQYRITKDNLWKTYFFYAYGIKLEDNCLKCPETTKIIEAIPGMKTAFFSILLPHKHIPEHCGPYKGVIRYHLALKVPEQKEQCGIRVGNDIRHWREGKSLIFDDTFPHEAWNKTNDLRVVLFLDFVRPMRFPWSIINQFIIKIIACSPLVQKGKKNLDKWNQLVK